ncbi:Outer membrane protein OmpA [Promicromonospora umidemergens]|uniref:OmpA-like domain-containing protein n=1 Tax=Promicromonospora umidemergens TaxID=629679 RepID=A0ABP8XBD9_9MICO|nr:OmpA family protein [Promicromonospora umidemergens]MCP2283114.1 Outer membrane protein OmpA [Promicromonospora umidemergens]
MRRVVLTALAVGLVGILPGCGLVGPGPSEPTGSPSRASAPQTSPGGTTPPGEVVAVDREWHGALVHLDVRPVEVDGSLAVLRYEYSAAPVDPAAELRSSDIVLAFGGLGNSVTDGRGVRLFDTGEGSVHPVARTLGGFPAAAIEQVDDEPDAVRGSAVAVFAAPVNESVDVLFPEFGVVTVPVVAAGDGFDSAVEQVGGVGDAETKNLRAFTQAYDDESRTSAQDGDVTVTLASDVLFASDKHTLSTSARNVVDKAAASILEQADDGEVRVVGHTDDVDTDAYNQKLSDRRARSVAEHLRAQLGGDYSVTEEGRGETEPVADGTSPEARAANRRVEIHFQGHLVVERDATSDVPETDAPTAKNSAVTYSSDNGEYTVEVRSMVRRPEALVGTLVAERVAGESIDGAWFLPAHAGIVGDRAFGTLAEAAGPHNLSLLGGSDRVLPFDYVTEKRPGGFVVRRLLGDEQVTPLELGERTLITVVWPDTGQDTVTVDAPDRFRITDVPVTDPPTGD